MDYSLINFNSLFSGITDMLTDSNILIVALVVAGTYEGFRFAKWLYHYFTAEKFTAEKFTGLPEPATEQDFRDAFEREYPDLAFNERPVTQATYDSGFRSNE